MARRNAPVWVESQLPRKGIRMPSHRMIDPACWHSETIAALSIPQRYFFISIFSNADDQGRLRAHPALLRPQLYSFDDISLDEIREALAKLVESGFISLYSVQGKDYLQIPNWWTYQRPRWARPSNHPPPEGWTDRVRFRQGNTVVKKNWDGPEEAPGSEPDGSELAEEPLPEEPEIAAEPSRDHGGLVLGSAPRGRGRGSNSNSGQDGARPPPGAVVAVDSQRELSALRAVLPSRGVGEPALTELVQASWVAPEMVDASCSQVAFCALLAFLWKSRQPGTDPRAAPTALGCRSTGHPPQPIVPESASFSLVVLSGTLGARDAVRSGWLGMT